MACLRGHANLVRTVQARFGDVPGSQLEEEAEARAIDRQFLAARLSGSLGREMTREQRRRRNPGGREPKDIFAFGAKLPPGGGGSRWARIVSGSYDETVIIWKRDSKGKWTPAHQLYQWEAVLRAGGQPRHVPGQNPHHPGRPNQALHRLGGQQPRNAVAGANPAVHHSIATMLHAQGATQTQPRASQASSSQVTTAATHLNASNSGTPTPVVAGSSTASSSSSTPVLQIQGHLPPTQTASQPTLTQPSATAVPTTQNQAGQQQAQSNNPFSQPLPHHSSNPPQAITQPQPNPQPAHPQIQAVHAHGHAHGQPAAANTPGAAGAVVAHNGPGTNSRVFKLQFDSRRIICCSQDPTIVGWDFANGDREIEVASEFFGEDV